MPGDSEQQRLNAKGPRVAPRLALAGQLIPTPEQEDAEELLKELDEEVSTALQVASGQLPKGEQFDTARGSSLLSMQARHDLIVKMRSQGMRVDRIARALGVSKTTIDKVVDAYFTRVEKRLRNQRMDQFVLMMAEGYLEDMDLLTASLATTRNVSSIVGGIRARQDAREKYVNLLADFGFINRKPTELTISGDGVVVDARTQNVIVVTADQIKAITKDLLAQKRAVSNQPSDPEEDERLATLVVTAESSA